MSDNTILIALIGSGVLSVLVSGVVTIITKILDRRWNNADALKSIQEQLKIAEKDSVRTQMLLMMSDYPEDKHEIMKLAEHYFVKLKANWYMTGMFNKWLEENDIAKPEWFNHSEE